MDYQSIINGITFDSIIHLMEELGNPVCKETDEYICFKTICHNIDIALRHRAPPLTFSYIISNFPTFSIAHYNGNPHICPAPGPAGLVFSPQIW